MTSRACVECGTPFTPWGASDPKRFCSRSCAARARCRTPERNANWRGGKTFHPLYEVYMDMLARCTRPSHMRWADYGGRGITVCDRWRGDFWAYVEDVGERPAPGMSIDRTDNDGPYSPGNVRWATPGQQRHNRRPQRRKPTCCRGHEYTADNTRIDREGKRHCRACERHHAALARRRHGDVIRARKREAAARARRVAAA